jgi:hypothetical protein
MNKRLCRGRVGSIGIPVIVMLILGAAWVLPGGTAGAQEEAAAPDSVDEPPFGIPLELWTVEAVTGLRTEFVEGVAGQVLAVAEGQAAGEVRDIAATSDELVAVGRQITSTMNRIGSLDSSFGIEGISRLATAGNAQRDTLFGLVIWHASSAGESRKIADDLEGTIGLVNDLAGRAKRYSAEIAEGSDLSRNALGQGEFAHLESSSSAVVQATAGLIEVSDRLQEEATRLEEIVWEIQGNAEDQLEGEWKKVLLSVSEVRRLAAKFRPAVESFESSNHVFWKITEALGGVVETTSSIETAESNPHAVYRIPAEALERDVAIASELDATALSDSHNGHGYSEESKAAIRRLLGKLLRADRILAERAVEHSSTAVARAEDVLEIHYAGVVGYSENDPERRRNEALSRIDLAMRSNEDLEEARTFARGARAALDSGTAEQERGAGGETQALRQYVSAWEQALEAGASAKGALTAVTSE